VTSRKDEQKQRSRAAILASAGAFLRRQGIRASSVMDVMRGAGLTVGGFYGHFESKEQLFTRTIQHAARVMWDRLVATARGATPRERLQSVMGRYLSRSHRDHPEDGCLLPSVVPEVAREGEPYRQALAAELESFVRTLGDLLVAGGGRRDEAPALIALMYGGLSLSRAVAGTPLSDDFLRAARALGARAVAPEP
jgi:TetR/AcrR family transcriptional repressor of nem operon